MIVVRLPDSPTEYGHLSVSPHTTSTCESGTPSSSAAMIPIVGFAPAPTSVTPTNRVYLPLASTCSTALLDPTPEQKLMYVKPAPRFSGPLSDPGTGRHRLFQS